MEPFGKGIFTNRNLAQLQDDIYGVFAFDTDIIQKSGLYVNYQRMYFESCGIVRKLRNAAQYSPLNCTHNCTVCSPRHELLHRYKLVLARAYSDFLTVFKRFLPADVRVRVKKVVVMMMPVGL